MMNNTSPESEPSGPHIHSYDTGYEHSLEHYYEMRALAQELDKELAASATKAMAAGS